MDVLYFIQGIFLGFYVATTIGVGGALSLQNMMSGNTKIAVMSALACSLADMTCGIIAVFGMKALWSTLMAYQWHFQFLNGITLCVMGILNIFTKLIIYKHHKPSLNMWAAVGSIYFLSIVDPVTIIDFISLSLGLSLDFSVHVMSFIIGMFVGSLIWWMSLCFLSIMLHSRISVTMLQYVQQFIGALICGFGLVTLSRLL